MISRMMQSLNLQSRYQVRVKDDFESVFADVRSNIVECGIKSGSKLCWAEIDAEVDVGVGAAWCETAVAKAREVQDGMSSAP